MVRTSWAITIAIRTWRSRAGGANLPHYWRYDDNQPDATGTGPYSIVIHFRENFWGDAFLNVPENKPLKVVLDRAKRGLPLTNQLALNVAGLMEELRVIDGPGA